MQHRMQWSRMQGRMQSPTGPKPGPEAFAETVAVLDRLSQAWETVAVQ